MAEIVTVTNNPPSPDPDEQFVSVFITFEDGSISQWLNIPPDAVPFAIALVDWKTVVEYTVKRS